MNVVEEQYPSGSTFRLPLGSGETLDVYQGEFRVSVRLVAPKGSSMLTGALHYQACDNAVCYPPKMLPVMVAVTGPLGTPPPLLLRAGFTVTRSLRRVRWQSICCD